jgi:hypothetical protein
MIVDWLLVRGLASDGVVGNLVSGRFREREKVSVYERADVFIKNGPPLIPAVSLCPLTSRVRTWNGPPLIPPVSLCPLTSRVRTWNGPPLIPLCPSAP